MAYKHEGPSNSMVEKANRASELEQENQELRELLRECWDDINQLETLVGKLSKHTDFRADHPCRTTTDAMEATLNRLNYRIDKKLEGEDE
jgi:predicted RNase H-like nuclease (RuvC/YqgF family)